MEVILLHDVPKVGKKHDIAKVAAGFARNFLIPRKMAEHATENKKARLAELRKRAETERGVQADLLEKNLDALRNVTITLSEKANEQGHLFKGIHEGELLSALKEQKHIELPDDAIALAEPVKSIGTHEIPVEVGGTKTHFTLVIDKR